MIDWIYSATSPLQSMWLTSCRQPGDPIDGLVDELVAPLREAIAHGCRTGTLSSPDPDADAQAIFHLILGMLVTHVVGGRPGSRAQLELTAWEMIKRALRVDEEMS